MRLEAGEIRIGRIHDMAQRLFNISGTFVGIKAHEVPLRIPVDQICEGLISHYSPPRFAMGLCEARSREILGPANGFAAKRHSGRYACPSWSSAHHEELDTS